MPASATMLTCDEKAVKPSSHDCSYGSWLEFSVWCRAGCARCRLDTELYSRRTYGPEFAKRGQKLQAEATSQHCQHQPCPRASGRVRKIRDAHARFHCNR